MNRMCQTLIAACFIAGIATAGMNSQMKSRAVSDDHVTWICCGYGPAHGVNTTGLNDDAAQDVTDVICCLNNDMVGRNDGLDDKMKPIAYLKQTI